MSEFNENPFAKNTPVLPFSNASEAESWQDLNCYKCINYDSESEYEDKAKCKLAYWLDYGYVEGTIPIWTAKEIGCVYSPLYQTCILSKKCRKFSTGTEPF